MSITAKKIWNIASTVIVILVVLCAIILMGSRVLGFQCYTVISGSMEPTFSVGDLLYVKKVDPSTIQVGDPITFILNEDLTVATHRVIRIDAENKRIYTKGDANEIEDQDPVHFNNVIGLPKFAIPKLGYVSNFVQNPPGTYIALGCGVALILAVFLPDLLKKKKVEEANAETTALQEASSEMEEENQRLKEELEKLKAEMANKDAE